MTHYDKKGKVIMKSYSFDEKNLGKSRFRSWMNYGMSGDEQESETGNWIPRYDKYGGNIISVTRTVPMNVCSVTSVILCMFPRSAPISLAGNRESVIGSPFGYKPMYLSRKRTAKKSAESITPIC